MYAAERPEDFPLQGLAASAQQVLSAQARDRLDRRPGLAATLQ
jgi:hypothetical protein